MVRKMFEKAGLIPGLQAGPKPALKLPGSRAAKSKTAPGTMMGFLTAQSTAMVRRLRRSRSASRRSKVRRHCESWIHRPIKPSKWANRHEASFLTAEFEELKAEIAAAGGNVQPIKVRPVEVLNGSTPSTDTTYELIFGHRRHRACAGPRHSCARRDRGSF